MKVKMILPALTEAGGPYWRPIALGGLHATSLPQEAARRADTVCLGPGEDTWPTFLADYRAGRPRSVYPSRFRSLLGAPPPRRDLFRRYRYLMPNSLVVSHGCPYGCDFCYKEAFFQGGRSFYTQAVDDALAEIERLPGRHLCFLDGHIRAGWLPHLLPVLEAVLDGCGERLDLSLADGVHGRTALASPESLLPGDPCQRESHSLRRYQSPWRSTSPGSGRRAVLGWKRR